MQNFRSLFFLLMILICCLLPLSFLLKTTKASSLGEGYLFLERMQTNTATGMTGMFTPSTNFNTDTRELRIIFPESEGAWCKQNSAILTITGVSSSPIDQGDWSIDEVLPGGVGLAATCYQGGVGENDYISITGIGNLVAGTSYGFKIDANGSVFTTGSVVGSNLISYQLIEGTKIETTAFSIALLASDQVTVTAEVSESPTITCTLSTSTVNLGSLFRGGAYITGGMSLTTESTNGFYWAVYGQGDGNDAGLYTSESTGYLLSSAGSEGEVNLLTGEGFGMLAETNHGYVPSKYSSSVAGIFGPIGYGVSGASVLLYADSISSVVNTNIYFGARAGAEALAGNYEETITYICGAYIGEGVFSFASSEPLNLSASEVTSNSILLEWDEPAESGEGEIVGYKIERSSSPWVILVENTNSTITSYLDETVQEGMEYSYRVSAVTNYGFLHASSELFVQAGCSTGMIPVPSGNGNPSFCVDKYEAKIDTTANGQGNVAEGSCRTTHASCPGGYCNTWNYINCSTGTIVSTASGSPIANINQIQARSACESVGKRLISNEEWLQIANNAEGVGWNWSTGTVGSGNMSDGHSDSNPWDALEASSDDNPCYGTGNICDLSTWHSQRRTYRLSNGEYIWDFGGNVWQWVDETVENHVLGSTGESFPNNWDGWSACSSPSDFRCGNTYQTNDGRWSGNTTALRAFRRGGSWYAGAYSGAFPLYLSYSPSFTGVSSGFRCAR
jgi:formylglycine-generating enzyme required for sulfatase activity